MKTLVLDLMKGCESDVATHKETETVVSFSDGYKK